MDNLTHTLTGLALSRAGLNRQCPHATAILLIASNIPDIDIVSAFGGSLAYLHYHRHLTHSLLLMPVMAALAVLLVRPFAKGDFAWARGFALALAGVASHLLLDWTNAYGIRLLLPFSNRWLRLDITNIVDPWIWTILILTALWPLLSRLVSSEIGARVKAHRGSAILALVLLFCYDCGRLVLHARAVNVIESRLYGRQAPVRAGAFPSLANPLDWTGVAETASLFAVNPVNLLQPFDPDSGSIFYKPDSSPAIEAARHTPVFENYLAFAQFPVWSVTPGDQPEGSTRVQVTDLRFGSPSQPRFYAVALIDAGNHLVRSRFQFGAPRSGR